MQKCQIPNFLFAPSGPECPSTSGGPQIKKL